MNPETLDQITVDLIFALRDSLTDVSRLDFWSGRATTAIETAAAGSETWEQAVTTAARKLQIDTLTNESSKTVVALSSKIESCYEEWAAHVSRNIVYIVALANVMREQKKTKKAGFTESEQEPTF